MEYSRFQTCALTSTIKIVYRQASPLLSSVFAVVVVFFNFFKYLSLLEDTHTSLKISWANIACECVFVFLMSVKWHITLYIHCNESKFNKCYYLFAVSLMFRDLDLTRVLRE